MAMTQLKSFAITGCLLGTAAGDAKTVDISAVSEVVLAKRNAQAVGPWAAYLSVLKDRT